MENSLFIETQEKEQHIYLGSDCAYCSLEAGISCMIYFCRKASKKDTRQVCRDGFSGQCPDYRKNRKRG